MNKLEEKANELAAIAKSYGLEPIVEVHLDWYANVDYTSNISSHIFFTETGKVSVKTKNYHGGSRTETIAARDLEDYLKWTAENIKDREARAKEREARKFRVLV